MTTCWWTITQCSLKPLMTDLMHLDRASLLWTTMVVMEICETTRLAGSNLATLWIRTCGRTIRVDLSIMILCTRPHSQTNHTKSKDLICQRALMSEMDRYLRFQGQQRWLLAQNTTCTKDNQMRSLHREKSLFQYKISEIQSKATSLEQGQQWQGKETLKT